MSRIGDENVLARIATLRQRLVNHEDSGELSVSSRYRLQRHPRHAEDLFQGLFEMPEQLEISLNLMIRLQRMGESETGRAGDA